MSKETKTIAKEPFLRMKKRDNMSRKKALGIRLIAIVLALIVCSFVIIAVTGQNPIQVYLGIIDGAVGSSRRVWVTIRETAILLLVAVGLTPAFRMKFWNIGAEGQIIAGAICASYFALFHADLPHFLLMIIMFAAGIIGGGLYGLIPAFFKAKFGTNETLFTLMLNYIALYVIVWLRDGAWADPESGGFPKIARFVSNAQLDKVGGIQVGWIIGLILTVIVFIYLKYTKHGYEISVVSESHATARYAGMNPKKIMLRTMFLSGAVCGIAGMVQATGSDMTLATSVAGGVGFTAIIVAWLAQLEPIAILIVSFLFAVLEKGSSVMQSTFGLSTYCADVLQGIILFFVLAGEFFIRYKFVVNGKERN